MRYEWSDSLCRLEKKFCTKFLPHSVTDEQKDQSRLVKNSFRHVRPAHVLSVTSLMEMSLANLRKM
jgi:hypothetical protein